MMRLRSMLVLVLNILFLVAYLALSRATNMDMLDLMNTLAFFMFPLVGAVLLARQPGNLVGVLVTVIGLAVLGASAMTAYAALAMEPATAQLPLTGASAWLAVNMWIIVLPCVALLLLLFPDGRLPGPRWKWLVIFIFAVTAPMLLYSLVGVWGIRDVFIWMDSGRMAPNPQFIALNRRFDQWNLAIIAAIVLAMFSFLLRFRRSRGVERQQLKWFVFGLSTIPASMLLNELVTLMDLQLLEGFSLALDTLSIIAFPLVMLIAVTRYRLYDIDIIIRKTLLYAALTASLALVYFGLVVITQTLFSRQFGEQPELVIVLSTLAIAALVQPLRVRLQQAIDRRFYRSKYNAGQTAAGFAARLRNEVDPDAIEGSLLAVVEEHLQPEQASLLLLKKRP